MPKTPAPPTQDLVLAAFRMPKDLRQKAKAKAKAEDINFSQLMRRAVRRELGGTAK